MVDYKVIAFVENEHWLSRVEEMFTLMLGDQITAKKRSRYECNIKARGFNVLIKIGMKESSRGYRADMVLNLVRFQQNYSLEELNDLHQRVTIPIMNLRNYQERLREDKLAKKVMEDFNKEYYTEYY